MKTGPACPYSWNIPPAFAWAVQTVPPEPEPADLRSTRRESRIAASRKYSICNGYAKISVDIAATEITRIAVSGDRIALLRGTAGAYTVSNDNGQGAVFIKPVINTIKITKTCRIPKDKNEYKKRHKIFCQNPRKKRMLSNRFIYLSARNRDIIMC